MRLVYAVIARYWAMFNIFIYGGSFDPVHNGHLNTAQTIYQYFRPDIFLFVPCKQSLLKAAAHATAKQRLEMLELGIASLKSPDMYDIYDYELQSKEPSYTINTVNHLLQSYHHRAHITLILGTDAYNQLHRWHQWESIVQRGKLLIINRPGYSLDDASCAIKEHFKNRVINDSKAFLSAANNCISTIDCGVFQESSSEIRKTMYRNPSIQRYLPTTVLDYILREKLYK